jgi:hypothetical protein
MVVAVAIASVLVNHTNFRCIIVVTMAPYISYTAELLPILDAVVCLPHNPSVSQNISRVIRDSAALWAQHQDWENWLLVHLGGR